MISAQNIGVKQICNEFPYSESTDYVDYIENNLFNCAR